MITRSKYMDQDHPATHRKYYGQFVTDATRQQIRDSFDIGDLIDHVNAAREGNINAEGHIPLERWDAICFIGPDGRKDSGPFRSILVFDTELRKQADAYGVTRADLVCIAKEAAKQVVERFEGCRLLHHGFSAEELRAAQHLLHREAKPYGVPAGSFDTKLIEAMTAADEENLTRLLSVFEHYGRPVTILRTEGSTALVEMVHCQLNVREKH